MESPQTIIIRTTAGKQIIGTVADESGDNVWLNNPRELVMMDPQHCAMIPYMLCEDETFVIQNHAIECIGTKVSPELEKAYRANIAGLHQISQRLASVILRRRN